MSILNRPLSPLDIGPRYVIYIFRVKLPSRVFSVGRPCHTFIISFFPLFEHVKVMVKKWTVRPTSAKGRKRVSLKADEFEGVYGINGYSKCCDLHVLGALEYVKHWGRAKHTLECTGREKRT